MDTPFEECKQLSDAEKEEVRNNYRQMQEYFHGLQTYHRLLDDLYHELLEHHYFVEDRYHEAMESLERPPQEYDHALKDYYHAAREQRSRTVAYQDALQRHLQLMRNNYQKQNPQELP